MGGASTGVHSSTIRRLAHTYYPAALLLAAVELRIPDLLGEEPISPADIAAAAGADPSALGRLMRGLALIGVLEHVGGDRFRSTAISERLRSDAANSEAGSVRILAGEYLQAWTGLAESVRSGEPAYPRIFGTEFYERSARSPDSASDFAAVMRGDGTAGPSALAEAYDFGSSHIVDVGGGAGQTLAGIARMYPRATGTVVDSGPTARMAQVRFQAEGLADRCDAVPGDFFSSVPPGADLYLLRAILPDWNDARARKILQVCRDAMRADSVLLVVNRVMPDELDGSPAMALLVASDLENLVVKGGKERTIAEHRSLLESAGLRLRRVIPLRSGRTILEATPVAGSGEGADA